MKQFKFLAMGVAALGLIACQDGGFSDTNVEADMHGGYAAPAPVEHSESFKQGPAPTDGNISADVQQQTLFLAYRYNYGLTASKPGVKALFETHTQSCISAGPSKCQIMSSGLSGVDTDYVNGNLQFRAAPDWLETFRNGLAGDAEKAGGKVDSSSVSSEDLTRAILDTDARLTAKTELRGRLEALLANRDASVDELLKVERELARVQGEIESATANLKAMRTRVSMSEVYMNYRYDAPAASASSFSPIGDALGDFFSNISYGLAGVITMIALVLPWLIIIIPVIWLFMVWRRKVRARKLEEKMATEKMRQADA